MAKLFVLIKMFITGMVGCRRCAQSAGLPLQRPWVTSPVYTIFMKKLHIFCPVISSKQPTKRKANLPAGLEELWFGINFDPFEGALSWEPACPVAATVSLCHAMEKGSCAELPGTSHNVTREKVDEPLTWKKVYVTLGSSLVAHIRVRTCSSDQSYFDLQSPTLLSLRACFS